MVLSGHLQRRMSFEPDLDLESGRDEGGVWFWERVGNDCDCDACVPGGNAGHGDELIRRSIPWTSIAWIEEE